MSERAPRRKLWIVAVVAMLALAAWQRYSGPTYPARPAFSFLGKSYRARLVRSGTTGEPVRVEIPAPLGATKATLSWRRYPTNDPFTLVPMTRKGDVFCASLPSQPPAGKVEYSIRIEGQDLEVTVPNEDPVVLRFKGDVPLAVLIPHVIFMFLAVLFGIRTGLAALFSPGEIRKLTFLTLGGMTVGGLLLGPIVQKFAFGEYWTGFPYGYDLTDNKTLLLWLVWAAAAAILIVSRRKLAGRLAVVLATVLMLFVYLIPHSLRGSQLDYGALRKGKSAVQSIRTGRVPDIHDGNR